MSQISYDDGRTWVDVADSFVELLIEKSDRDDLLVNVSGRRSREHKKPWRLDALRRKRAEWRKDMKHDNVNQK